MGVEFLCHFNETNGSTTFTESSLHTWTDAEVGSITATTTNPKWGTACLDIPGGYPETLTFTRTGYNKAVGGVWSIDFWIYIPTAYPTVTEFVLRIPNLLKFYHSGNSNNWQLYNWANNRLANFNETDIGLDGWHHVAFCADGDGSDNVIVYVDGAYVTQTTSASSLWGTVSITDLEIILGSDDNTNDSVTCKIDEFRFLGDEYVNFATEGAPTGEYDDPIPGMDLEGSVDFDVNGGTSFDVTNTLLFVEGSFDVAVGGSIDIAPHIFSLVNVVGFDINGSISANSEVELNIGGSFDTNIEGEFTIGNNLISGEIDIPIGGSIGVLNVETVSLVGSFNIPIGGDIDLRVDKIVTIAGDFDIRIDGSISVEQEKGIFINGSFDFDVDGNINLAYVPVVGLSGSIDVLVSGVFTTGTCSGLPIYSEGIL